MKKKVLAGILTAVIGGTIMSGCGGSAASVESAAASVESTAASVESTAASAGENSAADGDSESQAAELDEKQAAFMKEVTTLMSRYGRPVGGLIMDLEAPEPEEITEEEGAELDRAMRAYTPSADSLLVNKAKNFYYYEKLDADQQLIYDTILMLAEDPTDTDNIAAISLDVDPDYTYYTDVISPAYYALLYDHPELFWLYAGVDNYLGFGSLELDGGYVLYIGFTEPYTTYEQDMKAFNQAAESFLADIDLTQGQTGIADAIHDKLIGMVTYDYDVAERNEGRDLAHSAYGALVANSSGVANTCVCDGYSMAYVYLCQQAGLEATFLCGMAGADEDSAGGHAWSIVKVEDNWKEVDACWDDFDNMFMDMEAEYKDKTDTTSVKIMQAITDEAFTDAIKHYLDRVSTPYITNFNDVDAFIYPYDDGTALVLLTESVHIRMNNISYGGVDSILMDLAPVAE